MCSECQPVVRGNTAEVVIRMGHSNLDSVRVFRIGLFDSSQTLVEKAVLYSSRDSLLLRLPRSSDILYQVQFQYSGLANFFIADELHVSVSVNSKTGEWGPTGSLLTDSIQALVAMADRTASTIERVKRRTRGTNRQPSLAVEFSDSANTLERQFQMEVRTFCQTTTNPTAFLVAYQFLHLEPRDGTSLLLVREALRRFPASIPLRRLAQELNDVAAIYAQELKIGDALPPFVCKDLTGSAVSSSVFQGRYVLLDFWASYSSSIPFHSMEHRIFDQIDTGKLMLTGIALDDDITACQRLVAAGSFKWRQWIDTAMWRGRVVKALKFDSIPFNLLISPDQRVLEKAIPPDSLPSVLRHYGLLRKPGLRQH